MIICISFTWYEVLYVNWDWLTVSWNIFVDFLSKSFIIWVYEPKHSLGVVRSWVLDTGVNFSWMQSNNCIFTICAAWWSDLCYTEYSKIFLFFLKISIYLLKKLIEKGGWKEIGRKGVMYLLVHSASGNKWHWIEGKNENLHICLPRGWSVHFQGVAGI